MGLLGDDDLEGRLRLVRSTETTPARSISPSADLVAVEGTVRVHRETVDLPLADATVTEIESGSAEDRTDAAAQDAADGQAPDAADGATAGGGDGPPSGAGADDGSGEEGTESSGDVAGAAESGPTIDELARSEERGPPVLATYTRRERDGPRVLERRLDAVPFVVEDESGRVLVDVTDLGDDAPGVLLSAGNTERFLGTESGDRLVSTGGDSFRQVAAARNAIGTTPEYEHERSVLRAGDRVYVIGAVRSDGGSTGDDPETVVFANPADTDRFVLSDMSRSALAEQLDRARGGLDREFWLFVVVGAIAAIVVLITIAVFLDSFVL